MSTTKDGGPAFPVASDIYNGSGLCGMSLRDWFAGQALAGLLACPDISGGWESISKSAYTYADAMLRARERGVEVDDDEAWFRAQLNACVYSRSDGSHEATIDYGALSWTAFGANRAAAIRDLRSKVEGGGQ